VLHHIRRKIIQATEELQSKINSQTCCILLYLPNEDKEELTSLYLQYLSKKWKINLVSLGNDIDIRDLKDASAICHPGYILSFYNPAFSNNSFPEFVEQLRTNISNQKIIIYIPSDFNISEEYIENVLILKGKNQFEKFLKDLRK